MAVDADAQLLQLGLELVSSRLAGIAGDNHTSHIESLIPKLLDQTQHIHVIGDPKIMADLVLFNISGMDCDHDLCLIGKLQQHLQLTVRLKPGKDPGGVIVVKKLSSEFEIQLIPKLTDTVADMF